MTEKQSPHGPNYPRTVEEAVERLINELPMKNKVRIAKMPESNLIDLHMALGLYIRNEYGLHDPKSPLMVSIRGSLEYWHDPDDVSMMIIREFWKRLQESM